LVDEDYNNFFEIYEWIAALGPTETFEQYAALKAMPVHTQHGPYSDIVLSSLNSARNSNHNFTFVQAHPVALASNLTAKPLT
jgi:hypothetical protein